MEWIKTIVEVIALLFAGFQIFLLARQIKNTREWNKTNSTFEEIEKLKSCIEQVNPDLIETIGLLKSDSAPVTRETYDSLMKDSQNAKDLYLITYFYESFSVAVLCGRINENIAKRLLYVNLTRAYYKLKPYINLRSETVGTNIVLCQHFKQLSDRWESNNPHYSHGDFKDKKDK